MIWKIIEFLIAFLGIAGTMCVSFSLRVSVHRIGMVLWIVSNVLAIIFFARSGMWYLLGMNIVYFFISAGGLIRRR